MRRLLVVIVLVSCAVLCIAQDKSRTKTNKAGIYDNIYEVYMLASKHRSDSTCLKYAEQMRQLALKQGDKRAYAMSYANPLSYYLAKSKEKEFMDTADKLMKTSEEIKLWSFYYHALSQKSVYYLRKHRIGEAIQLGEQTMQKAYADNNRNGIYVSHTMLLNSYLLLRLYSKAEEEAGKALKAEIGLPDNNFGNSLAKYAEIYYIQRRWQDCLNIIAKYENLVESNTVHVRLVEYKTICNYALGNTAEYESLSKELPELYAKYGQASSGGLVHVLEGVKLMNEGKTDQAEAVFGKLGSPDQYYYLFNLYQKTGNKKDASKAIEMLNSYWASLQNELYDTDLKKYGLELDNNNLQRSNRELELERNQLALTNQNLKLGQSIFEMKNKQAQSELEQSRLNNKYLEAKNKESKTKAQLLETALQDKQHRMIILGITTLLGILMLFGLILYWNIRSSNIKLKKANVKLAEQNQQLADDLLAITKANEASDAKTTFLFNMSHDIRTPMNAILGFANLVKKEKNNPEMVDNYIDKIRNSGDYLLSFINNVLDMARIESGKAELDEVFYDMLDPANDAAVLFEELAAKKHITLTHSDNIQHRYVLLDKMKIQQIIVNILSNAIKYTPEGGKVHYSFDEIPCEREGYATFVSTVTDNGIGMTPEFAQTIFEKFSRERNTTESKVIGTGLGMSIVKKLVDLMQGTIEVQTELGKGSTFIVTISHPIVQNPEDYQAKPHVTQNDNASDSGKASDTGFKAEGKRILLAEDNELNAEIATTILEDYGFKIEHAEDGVQCVKMLSMAEDGYYDCILMDVQMPNLNGYDATRRIRALSDKAKAEIPIIAMTANAFEEDKRNAKEAGMNGHIAKPINVEELISTLSGIVK